MLGGKLRGKFLQTVGAPCGQHQIRASGGQELREFKSNPSARAGDQRPLPGPSFQRVMCHTVLRSMLPTRNETTNEESPEARISGAGTYRRKRFDLRVNQRLEVEDDA